MTENPSTLRNGVPEQELLAFDADQLAEELARVFAAADAELYLVGGAVRDRLLGKDQIIRELDFATSARPDETLRILESMQAGTAYRVGERFGTIGWRLGERVSEITTYRAKEEYTLGSRKPEVIWGNSLNEDLSRRDFTVNAIGYDPLRKRYVDPLNGQVDLRLKCLRAVGDPNQRFTEDPLRLLRAVRLASHLNFNIEAETWNALRTNAEALTTISRERIRDEYSKILVGDDPVRGLTLLRDGHLMKHSVPQLLELIRMHDHGPRHPLSLWDHVMQVVAVVPRSLVLRWAALLHDIAKPQTRTTEPGTGRPRFFHHEVAGAAMSRHILTGLRYSNQMVDDVALLVESHMQLHAYSPEWSDGAVRRLVLRMGTCLPDALLLVRADAAGHSLDGTSHNAQKFDSLEARIKFLDETEVRRLKSPLSGTDLMNRYGRPPGPWIRRVKGTLEDEVLEGRLAPDDREGAWRLADLMMEDA